MCTLYKHWKVTGQTQVIISSVLRANIRKMQIAKNSKYCKKKNPCPVIFVVLHICIPYVKFSTGQNFRFFFFFKICNSHFKMMKNTWKSHKTAVWAIFLKPENYSFYNSCNKCQVLFSSENVQWSSF